MLESNPLKSIMYLGKLGAGENPVSSGEIVVVWVRPISLMDFRGFDSSIISILRGGIPKPIRNFPELSSQAILVGIMLVGRFGVVQDFELPSHSSLNYLEQENDLGCLHQFEVFLSQPSL